MRIEQRRAVKKKRAYDCCPEKRSQRLSQIEKGGSEKSQFRKKSPIVENLAGRPHTFVGLKLQITKNERLPNYTNAKSGTGGNAALRKGGESTQGRE